MNYQMKSSRRHTGPCPCRGVCPCHVPAGRDAEWVLVGLVLVAVICFGLLVWHGLTGTSNDANPSVTVDGKKCELVTVTDRCTSTGACSSHYEARCP